jgi:hypothetical protein
MSRYLEWKDLIGSQPDQAKVKRESLSAPNNHSDALVFNTFSPLSSLRAGVRLETGGPLEFLFFGDRTSLYVSHVISLYLKSTVYGLSSRVPGSRLKSKSGSQKKTVL